MIRALILWLAKDEIDHAVEIARAEERQNAVLAASLCEQAGYLRGHAEGVRYAFQELDKAVGNRTGDSQNPFTAEDVAATKKGITH